jgi:hypothetical protein
MGTCKTQQHAAHKLYQLFSEASNFTPWLNVAFWAMLILHPQLVSTAFVNHKQLRSFTVCQKLIVLEEVQ